MLHNIDEQRQIAAVRPKSFLISVRKVLTRKNISVLLDIIQIGGRGGGLRTNCFVHFLDSLISPKPIYMNMNSLRQISSP